MAKIRILLADDHAVLRAGLRMLLNAQPDIEVIGEAVDGAQAVEQARRLQPDIVLMDITMPGMDGLAATKDIRKCCPGVKVLALTMHDDPEYLRQMLRAGASGYVVKKAADVELTTAIRAVHRGEVFLYPSVARGVVEDYLDGPSPARGGEEADNLTDREREVLRLIAQGYTNREAADRLCISVKTIETHRAHLMEKLEIRSRAGLTRYAMQKGLLDQGD